MSKEACEHFSEIRVVTPAANGCQECMAAGDSWRHLRLCLTCGHVGCCDNSKNKHATQHFLETGHPIVKSFEPGQDWGWCFVDRLYFDRLAENRGVYRES